MENRILKALNEVSMDIDLLSEYLNMDKASIEVSLNKLISEGKIKQTKGGLYKVIRSKYTTITDEEILLYLEYNPSTIGEISRVFKQSKERIEEMLTDLINTDKVLNRRDRYFVIKTARVVLTEAGIFKAIIDDYPEAFNLDTKFKVYDSDLFNVIVDRKERRVFAYKLIERGHFFVVGILKSRVRRGFKEYYIKSTMQKFNENIILKDKVSDDLIDSVVRADLIYEEKLIFGTNLTLIGREDAPGIEISKIALEYGFDLDFDGNVIKELDGIENFVKEEEYKGRRDFRNKNIITIDGVYSKDFDDAVYLELLPNGNYSLEVHIADVSNYVKEGMELNKEALKRGTSLYLADRVIPMLPPKLSNGICSLNPGVDRLVLSAIIELNKNGKVVNYEIVEGVINSHYRMTYDDVNKILQGDNELTDKYIEIKDMLFMMEDLSKVIRNIRTKKGGLEFDTEEYSFNLNPDGSPKEIVKRQRDHAEMLIEDFMVLANEVVAYHMNIMNLPIVYRIHEKPDIDRVESAINDLKAFDINYKKKRKELDCYDIQEVLKLAEENKNKFIINNILLRSMMKAKYSNQSLGHYGLGLKYYCHFTSPIRRYPDLITHRMIKKLLLNPSDNLDKEISYYYDYLGEVAKKNSLSERNSIECEREVDDMLYAWYMEDKIGNIYSGIITSITSFGMFIEIGQGIEGLFLYKKSESFFNYYESTKTADDGRKLYRIGDKVRVSILDSSKEKRKIEFMLEK